MNIKNPLACRILSVCLVDVPVFMLRLILEHVPRGLLPRLTSPGFRHAISEHMLLLKHTPFHPSDASFGEAFAAAYFNL